VVRIHLEENGSVGALPTHQLLSPGPIDFEAKVSKPRRRWKEESECAESWKRKRGTRCTRAREVEL